MNPEIVRGAEAENLVNNPLYKGAIEAVRAGIISSMNQSPFGDEKTHNRLVISLQLLNQIEKQLKDHIQTGRMAEMQINESLTDRIRRVF